MKKITNRPLLILLLSVSFFILFDGQAQANFQELNLENISPCQFTKDNSCQNKQSA